MAPGVELERSPAEAATERCRERWLACVGVQAHWRAVARLRPEEVRPEVLKKRQAVADEGVKVAWEDLDGALVALDREARVPGLDAIRRAGLVKSRKAAQAAAVSRVMVGGRG